MMVTAEQRQAIREDAERRQAAKPVGSYGYNDAGVTLALLADVDKLLDDLYAAETRIEALRAKLDAALEVQP
jgi:uncharacterized protein YPO0396